MSENDRDARVPAGIEMIFYFTRNKESLMRFACPACRRMTTRPAVMGLTQLACSLCGRSFGARGAVAVTQGD